MYNAGGHRTSGVILISAFHWVLPFAIAEICAQIDVVGRESLLRAEVFVMAGYTPQQVMQSCRKPAPGEVFTGTTQHKGLFAL